MKMNYIELGQKALSRLKSTAERAQEIQAGLLREILYENRNTEYGRKYHFSAIKDMGEYQKNVPITFYDDYDTYISRMIDGEEDILTKAPADFFCISSGTTGEAKYLPLTEKELGGIKIYQRFYPENWPCIRLWRL